MKQIRKTNLKTSISIVALLLLLISVTASFTSCNSVKIENYEWKMSTVMHGENDTLVVDAVISQDTVHSDARVIDMTLVANDGKLVINDITNNVEYEGTYSVESKTPEGTNYKITINGKTGYAGVAMTTYDDGRKEPTLPINLGEYSLYFYAD